MQDESARTLEELQAEMQRKIEQTRGQADQAIELSEKERERIQVHISCLMKLDY